MRWQHHQYGPIPPDEFIPIAEHTDLMLPLTTFVLSSALAQCAAWEAEGMRLSLAVNIAPQVLVEAEFPDLVTRLLAEVGLDAGRLTLEITESSIIADPARAIRVLERLDSMGVHLSIDDFGTGYSSLSYLCRLPVHEVKIDKSFVLHLPVEDDGIIVEATIELAHRLGKQVVAEGVETRAGWDELHRMGCDRAQGYFLSRPLAAPALTVWLRENACNVSAQVGAPARALHAVAR